MRIEWDATKDRANQKIHGISFAEAQQPFLAGVDYLELLDELHSDDENRFIAVGPIARGLVLIVWTERDEDVIRIISARWATKSEAGLYVSYMQEIK